MGESLEVLRGFMESPNLTILLCLQSLLFDFHVLQGPKGNVHQMADLLKNADLAFDACAEGSLKNNENHPGAFRNSKDRP